MILSKQGGNVFGIGKGKMDILLPKTYFEPGEIISGKVTFELKKPVQAKQLCISLIGEHKTTSRHRDGDGDTHTSTRTSKIHDFEVKLDGEKEYGTTGEYPFEIKAPADIGSVAPQVPGGDGILGKAMKMAQTAATMTGNIPIQQVKWYLSAKLDISGGLDVKKKADISIG